MTLRAHLRTARLVLRPVAPEDEGAVVAALNDLDVSGWLSVVPYPYASADFQNFQSRYAVPGQTFAVDDANGFVGIIGVEDRTLGYWFVPAKHGKGYATEAARAVLAAHFAENPADIASGYFEGNARSANVLRKLGFLETGRGMKYCRALGHDRPHVDMALTREAFAAANPLVIETDRLILRPLRESDAADLRRIVTIPDVGRMLLIFPPDWTEEAARAFTHTWRWKGDAMFRLAITRRGEDRLIGTIGIKQISAAAEAAIFYFLDPAEAGQGYATEALAALLPEIVRRCGPLPLLADVFTDNPGSARVLEKAGFIRTGTGMGISAARLEPAPIWLYRLDPQLPEACP
ncbi:MAG: GNAT family N-acetyltransferase [Paracoccaceae bacterium]